MGIKNSCRFYRCTQQFCLFNWIEASSIWEAFIFLAAIVTGIETQGILATISLSFFCVKYSTIFNSPKKLFKHVDVATCFFPV